MARGLWKHPGVERRCREWPKGLDILGEVSLKGSKIDVLVAFLVSC